MITSFMIKKISTSLFSKAFLIFTDKIGGIVKVLNITVYQKNILSGYEYARLF